MPFKLLSCATTAYFTAVLLAGGAVTTTVLALRVQWLQNRAGHILALTQYCVDGKCRDFPSRELCAARPGFCGAWRTAVFSVFLAVSLEVLALLAVGFSWTFQRRRRTVFVVHSLEGVSLALQLAGGITITLLVQASEYFSFGGWFWEGHGRLYLSLSIVLLAAISVLMLRFRALVVSHENGDPAEYSDSDDDDIDSVSVDEDIDEELRDFYVFTKQARRAALRRADNAGGSYSRVPDSP